MLLVGVRGVGDVCLEMPTFKITGLSFFSHDSKLH
jgi:hypothetical protein